MSIIDFFRNLFGSKNPYGPAPTPEPVNQMVNNSTIARNRNRQIYVGRQTELPEWANGIADADIIGELNKHVICKYLPKFEMKRVMSTQVGPDGNLVPEYSGIAGDCGAIKGFGLKVAQSYGLTMPYRYVDLNMAYRACCGNPKKCPFYLAAEGEMESVNSRRK